MRTRIYIDGKPAWSENVEGHAILYRGSIRGEIVVGGHGPNDRDVSRAQAAKSRAKGKAAA